jgi:hypothetical protein
MYGGGVVGEGVLDRERAPGADGRGELLLDLRCVGTRAAVVESGGGVMLSA